MIRNHLQEIAEEMGVNMAQIVKGTGLSRTSVHRIWHDKTEVISFEVLSKLCDFLNVGVGDLLEFVPDDEMTPEDHEVVERRREHVTKRNAWRYKEKEKTASQGN